jgi:membrane protein implicated in regulation of membrane protease activity
MFTLLRVGIFAAVLGVLLLVMPVEPWISAIVAAVIAFCLSFIFLAKPRTELSAQLHEQRQGPRDRDGEVEDAAVDSPDRTA